MVPTADCEKSEKIRELIEDWKIVNEEPFFKKGMEKWMNLVISIP